MHLAANLTWIANTTDVATPYVFTKAIVNLLELIGGLITIITNIFILAACTKMKRFSKEVVMVIGFSVGNLVLSIGYICTAIRRYYVHFRGPWMMLRSECVFESVHITMFQIGENFTFTLVVLISLDRLVAILSTKLYAKLCKRAIMNCIIVISMCSMLDYLIACCVVYFNGRTDRRISANCDHEAVLGPVLFNVHVGYLLAASYSSTIIYFVALMMTNCQKRVNDELRRVHLKREAVITKRVGLLVATEFIFLAIPFTFFCFNHQSKIWTTMCEYSWVVSSYGLCIEVIVCCVHNPEIKKALVKMYCRRVQQNRHMNISNMLKTRIAPSDLNSVLPAHHRTDLNSSVSIS